MTLQERKAALFLEIMDEIQEHCYDCPFSNGYDCSEQHCHVNDDALTAILSLDDPANFPQVFEK
jgi:hypothetical protein